MLVVRLPSEGIRLQGYYLNKGYQRRQKEVGKEALATDPEAIEF